ncbi:MAG: 30S ribosomal protein S2 [Saprospiraceae bacterium]|nr:30S ribosomal protein S2 [Saprospiraceae bacterium]
MQTPTYKELLNAGVHFGHMRSKWNPKMRPYIFMEKKGIHIIDLNRTVECLERAAEAMKRMAKSGKKIMYVSTKKQAKHLMADQARAVSMPHVTERWLGGMMTNFSTIRRSVKKMKNIDRMLNDGTLANVTKKERLTLTRERDKLERVLGGISSLNRLPHAIFVVDTEHEHLAIAEAKKLGIKTFAVVDTNSNPGDVDYPIPANDDATRSVKVVTEYLTDAIKQGLAEREKGNSEDQKDSTDS